MCKCEDEVVLKEVFDRALKSHEFTQSVYDELAKVWRIQKEQLERSRSKGE